jgi:lysophospholipase L1-like esterase
VHPNSFARPLAVLSLCLLALLSSRAAEIETWKFDFGSEPAARGFTYERPNSAYSTQRKRGFDLGSTVTVIERGHRDPLLRDFCTSDRPFFFSVALPEGNYQVSVIFGDAAGASTNTVKAESRRLMLEDVRTAPGKFSTNTFTVNVRTPRFPGGPLSGAVKLKTREKDYLHWDDKLTLEFNGARPALVALEIARMTNAVTVYLMGDSTVTDQPLEPWNSWGQMLPRFFNTNVAVANHAESGESIKSSLGARRFEKILSTIRPGDYVFVQFGHNDMKDRATNALAAYRAYLTHVVLATRHAGATPVLITSMERKAGAERDTLGDYPKTVREVAQEQKVALIDLHAMSRTLYRALGPERLGAAFQDGTHHNNYGSYELARCVVEAIRTSQLPLRQFLADDVKPFNPARPDAPEEFKLPASPQRDPATKPDGN